VTRPPHSVASRRLRVRETAPALRKSPIRSRVLATRRTPLKRGRFAAAHRTVIRTFAAWVEDPLARIGDAQKTSKARPRSGRSPNRCQDFTAQVLVLLIRGSRTRCNPEARPRPGRAARQADGLESAAPFRGRFGVGPCNQPRRNARTASTRRWSSPLGGSPSLPKMLVTCFSTARSVTKRLSAIA
jgi:hypothetical protein